MREALRTNDVPRIYGDVPPFMAVGARGHDRECRCGHVDMPHDGFATFRGGATRRGPQEISK
jgi:hypothetical protein